MGTRRILLTVSMIGVAATLIAAVAGAWYSALAVYVACAGGLVLLLRREVRKRPAAIDPSMRTALNEAPVRPAAQPDAITPRS